MKNIKIKIISVLLALLIMLPFVFAVPLEQERAIATLYTLFNSKAGIKDKFDNNIQDETKFLQLVESQVRFIKSKGPASYQVPLNIKLLTKGGPTEGTIFNINLAAEFPKTNPSDPDPVYKFLEAKAKTFSDSVVERYKSMVGASVYSDINKKQFTLTFNLYVPAHTADNLAILMQPRDFVVAVNYVGVGSDNIMYPVGAPTDSGNYKIYRYTKIIQMTSPTSSISIQVTNLAGIGYKMADPTNLANTLDEVLKNNYPITGPDLTKDATLVKADDKYRTLKVLVKRQVPNGKPEDITVLGLKRVEYPRVWVEEKNGAVWSDIGKEEWGSEIPFKLSTGKNYRICFQQDYGAYKPDLICTPEFALTQTEPVDSTFVVLYRLPQTPKVIEMYQTSVNEIKLELPADYQNRYSLTSDDLYKIVKAGTGGQPISVNYKSASVSGQIVTVTLEIGTGVVEDGSYKITLVPLGAAPEELEGVLLISGVELKIYPKEGDIAFIPRGENIGERIVNKKLEFFAQKQAGKWQNVGNTKYASVWEITKNNQAYSPSDKQADDDSLSFIPHQPGTYKITYKVKKHVDIRWGRDAWLFTGDKKDEFKREWTVVIREDIVSLTQLKNEIDRLRTDYGVKFKDANDVYYQKLTANPLPTDALTQQQRDVFKATVLENLKKAIELADNAIPKLEYGIKLYGAEELGVLLGHVKDDKQKFVALQSTVTQRSTADPAIEHKSFIQNNLEFEPAEANNQIKSLRKDTIRLKLNNLPAGVDQNTVFASFKINWIQTYTDPLKIGQPPVKTGKDTFFQFRLLPEPTTIKLEIKEEATGRTDVLVTKSWSVGRKINPIIVLENPRGSTNKQGDVVILKGMADDKSVTEDQINQNYFDQGITWTVTEPGGSAPTASLGKTTTDNQYSQLTLDKQGIYKIHMLTKSTHDGLNDLQADLDVSVTETKTAAGIDDYVNEANIGADKGKQLILDGNAANPVDNNKRDEGKRLIETAISDYGIVITQLDAWLIGAVAGTPQHGEFTAKKGEYQKKVSDLKQWLTDNYDQVKGKLFFRQPVTKEFARGSVVEFEVGSPDGTTANFEWSANPSDKITFQNQGNPVKGTIDPNYKGNIVVTAIQIDPATRSPVQVSGQQLSASITLTIGEKETTTISVETTADKPNPRQSELGRTEEFKIKTEPEGEIPRFTVQEGNGLIDTVQPGSGTLSVKLVDTAPASSSGEGLVRIKVYGQTKDDPSAEIIINLGKRNTIFDILNNDPILDILNIGSPLVLNVVPQLPNDNIVWKVEPALKGAVNVVSNQNVLTFDKSETKVNDVIKVTGTVIDPAKTTFGLSVFEDVYEFKISEDITKSKFDVQPRIAQLPIGKPLTLVASNPGAYREIKWKIKEDNSQLENPTITPDFLQATYTTKTGAVAGSVYHIDVTAGLTTIPIEITLLSANLDSIKIGGTTIAVDGAVEEKSYITKTTKQSIKYNKALGTDSKTYLFIDTEWYLLPKGASEDTFVDIQYFKKSKGIK